MFLRLKDDLSVNVNEIECFRPHRDPEAPNANSVLFLKTADIVNHKAISAHYEQRTMMVKDTVDEIHAALRAQGFLPAAPHPEPAAARPSAHWQTSGGPK